MIQDNYNQALNNVFLSQLAFKEFDTTTKKEYRLVCIKVAINELSELKHTIDDLTEKLQEQEAIL